MKRSLTAVLKATAHKEDAVRRWINDAKSHSLITDQPPCNYSFLNDFICNYYGQWEMKADELTGDDTTFNDCGTVYK